MNKKIKQEKNNNSRKDYYKKYRENNHIDIKSKEIKRQSNLREKLKPIRQKIKNKILPENEDEKELYIKVIKDQMKKRLHS